MNYVEDNLIDEFNSEDILCVINYGAALHGPNSQFAHILQDRNLGLMPSFELFENMLKISDSFRERYEVQLNKQSSRLMERFCLK
ncbi:hypothetical protein [Pseudoalteromonas piscicida]|uniref:hypothetical protein n=1 Tax=Pseudoalteromonas piscicida TaxID=43662 RepID=UPI001C9775CB|nr:hypothetical protein [Pseudoalteromonas piscicida]QZO12577.1 hypothetical protein K5642_16070 [Pseudoalteromonas piscicida]WMO15707.1 hypothetical protein NI376_09080 [Pseudoalteromonas piscicida]